MDKIEKKPESMSVKEHVYRRVSLENQIPYSTVKTVLDFQFSSALTALVEDINVNSLEIAGLGKILLNKRRLKAEIRKMRFLLKYFPLYMKEVPDLTLRELEKCEEDLRDCKNKLKEYLKRAEVLKIEVPLEEDLEEKVRKSVNKKIRERR